MRVVEPYAIASGTRKLSVGMLASHRHKGGIAELMHHEACVKWALWWVKVLGKRLQALGKRLIFCGDNLKSVLHLN